MKKHELFKFTAIVHPELKRQLEEWGREIEQSPNAFIDRIRDVVHERHESATLFRHATDSGPDLYCVDDGLVGIYFTVEEWWLVIRGLGESDAVDTSGREWRMFLIMDPLKPTVH